MKYYILTTLFLPFFLYSQNVRMGKVHHNDMELEMYIENNTDSDLIFHPNQSYFLYNIYDENGNYIIDDFFIEFMNHTCEDYGYKFSEEIVNKAMKKYKIDRGAALCFLEHSQEPLIIKKGEKKRFIRKYLRMKYLELDKSKNYYIEGVIYSQIEWFPHQYKTKISRAKQKILDRIIIPRTLVVGE